MESFYASAFAETEKKMGDEAQTWADEMTASREFLIHTAAGLASGNPEAEMAMAKEKGQEIATGVLEDWIHQVAEVKPEEAPKDLVAGIKGLKDAERNTTWRGSLMDDAGELAANDSRLKSIQPVTVQFPAYGANDRSGDVYEQPQTYTGNPYGHGGGPKYVSGPADDFISIIRKYGANGDAITKMTPRQLDAYSRWVQDPAVMFRILGRGAFDSVLGGETPSD